VAAQPLEQRRDPRPADERHHHVDGVGRVNLGLQLPANVRLARGVGQQGGVEQRDQRLLDHLRAAVRTAREERAQHLRRRHRRVVGRAAGAAGDHLDERSRQGDAGLHPLLVGEIGEGALDHAPQVQGDAVRRIGRPQVADPRHQRVRQGLQLARQAFRQQRLVEPPSPPRHGIDRRRIRQAPRQLERSARAPSRPRAGLTESARCAERGAAPARRRSLRGVGWLPRTRGGTARPAAARTGRGDAPGILAIAGGDGQGWRRSGQELTTCRERSGERA
jgi:hypothetical protein